MSGPVLFALRIAMALALYGFIGWALLTIWRDVRQQTDLLNTARTPPIRLRYQLEGQAYVRRFSKAEVTIGRDPASDCHLDNQTISAHHSRLTFHHGQWWVEDMRSTNGTFLNQENVEEPSVVTTGDTLRCGQVLLEIGLGEEASFHNGKSE
jgi:pSer/pThr/pTyr-binding forkhead associated (FHA) protein